MEGRTGQQRAISPSVEHYRFDEDSRRALLAAREAVWQAFFRNDAQALLSLLPDDTLAINAGTEDWLDRAGVLRAAEEFAGSGARLRSLEFERTQIQVYGVVVVVYTLYRYVLDLDGRSEAHAGRGTEIFVDSAQGWKNAGWHLDSGR